MMILSTATMCKNNHSLILIYISIYLYIYLSVCLPTYLPTYLSSIYVSSIYVFIYLSTCLFVSTINFSSIYAHSAVIEQVIPKHLCHRVHPDDIRRKHHEYSDLSEQECNEAYMAFIQQWPLYGSTVFEVIQAYTTTLPKNLWLAVNEVGIHILKRRDKEPLVTYEYKSIVNYRYIRMYVCMCVSSMYVCMYICMCYVHVCMYIYACNVYMWLLISFL